MLQPAIESESTPWTSARAMALLAAGTAHELNNPLSVIVGYLSLILNGKVPADKLLEHLHKVEAEAKQCRVVLDGLAQLADAVGGEHELVDLTPLLNETLDDLAAKKLSVSCAARGPLLVEGRAHGLLQLLRHLVGNAVESQARSLRVAVSTESGWLRLQLSDDGVGFRPSDLARAKQPFFSTKSGRLGLGLSLCEAVASDHGGSLELSSTPGSGATVCLSLPLASPAEESTP